MPNLKLLPMVLIAATAIALGACGAAPPKSNIPTVMGIFTSANDCATKNKLPLEQCSALIQRAIDVHYAKAKVYISERLCEAAEGVDRCERSAETQFRRRLAAFLIAFSTPPVAEALYAPKDKAVNGFATAGNAKTFLTVDETLIVTASAKAIAEGFVAGKRR